MKRHLQKALSFLIAASMVTSSMPITAAAQETTAEQTVVAYKVSGSVFEANKSYTLKAELRNANEQGNKSMAGAVMLDDAEVSVDAQGNAKLTLNFTETNIMGITCHATGLYLANADGETLSGTRDRATGSVTVNGNYVESDFVLADDNSATATITLPYFAEDGYYQGFINSSFMAAPVALWLDYASASETLADGDYTSNIEILRIDSDAASSASRSFNLTNVPVEAENGKIKVQLLATGPSASMIEKIEQDVDGTYTELPFTEVEGGKYVTVTLDNADDIKNIRFTINTGSSFGVMVNEARVKLVKDSVQKEYSGYVLMNIPYSEFYSAGTASIGDVDAITSATNKVGNYGKASGGYHSGVTASQNEDGSWAAVGGENGAKLQGVIWAVKADSLDDVKALGGTEITDASAVTTATAAHGNTSSNDLKGYQTLTEAPSYSYYVLDKAPENYLVLEKGAIKAGTVNASAKTINVTASYGTNWGDVQLNASEATDASDKIINAVVLTADDGTAKGLTLLAQVWSSKDIAWKVTAIDGLDGKTIKNIRYYCTVKDTDLTDTEVPEYVNYVYDYSVDLAIPQVYTGTVTAEFDNANQISLSGLPSDVKDLKAKVYYTTGGKNAVYTYLTPVVTDPADDDNDPVFVDVENGKIAITAGSTTNKAGVTVNYGEPVDDTKYTVELSSSNYILSKITTVYTAAQEEPEPKPVNMQSPAKAEKAADDTIRFVAGIDSLKYREVGFIFEANGKEVRKATKTVYSSIADSKLGTADFENAEYLYSFEISDIADLGTEIKATPFYVDLNGNEVKAESSVYTLGGLSEAKVATYAADDVVSGSAVEVYAEESKEDTAEDNNEIAKEEAVLPDTDIAAVKEVLD